MYESMASTLDHCVMQIRDYQQKARQSGQAFRPRWLMIILRTPKGWSAPRKMKGHYLEGFWRSHPSLKIRFVNVVDLFKLVSHSIHPHGLCDVEFRAIFTDDKPVMFNSHSYPWLIHRFTYMRKGQHNIHVTGYREKSNVDTLLGWRSRTRLSNSAAAVREELIDKRIRTRETAYREGTDSEAVIDWIWPF
jgi:phosphoketolase